MKDPQWQEQNRASSKSAEEEVLLHLSSAMSGESCPALGSPVQERQTATGESPTKAAKVIKGMEHLSVLERLRALGLLRLERIIPVLRKS